MQSDYRYQVEDVMGYGSQGSIVSGYDRKTKQVVAIKVVDISKPNGMIGYHIEVDVHKKLANKSKYICEMLDHFRISNEGLGLIIMKKYETDLFDLYFDSDAEGDALPEKQLKQLFKQIAMGVRDLHRNGIAHLDIKPENILVDAKGNAVVCDFGCSYYSEKTKKFTKKNRKAEKIVNGLQGRGTKKYSAPEVFETDEFDPFKADIYSLGVMLHVLATGYFPIPGDLSFAAQKVDETCLSLLQILLAVDPKKRGTIDEVLAHSWFPTGSNLKSLSGKLPRFLRR